MTKQNIKFIETKVAAIKLQGFNPKLDNKRTYLMLARIEENMYLYR